MKERVLIIIKPDGMLKNLAGIVFAHLGALDLSLVGLKLIEPQRCLLEDHYKHLKGQPFFEQNIRFMLGEMNGCKRLLASVYQGDNAIQLCRTLAGATNPEKADPRSIRGAFGRITTEGTFENVIHVSSDPSEAEREISLWFRPDELFTH